MVCSMFICLQNFLNMSDVKFMPASEIIFLGSLNSVNTILATFSSSSAGRLSASYNWKCAVVIINGQKCFIVSKKYHHQPPPTACMVLHMALPSFCSCVFWYSKHVTHHFIVLMPAFIFIQYTHSLATYFISSMSIWLLCNCSCICLCNRKGIIILFPFMTMPSIIASSYLFTNNSTCFVAFVSFV